MTSRGVYRALEVIAECAGALCRLIYGLAEELVLEVVCRKEERRRDRERRREERDDRMA